MHPSTSTLDKEGLRLIDIGVNLTSDRFQKDLDEVLARALSAGVSDLIITGVDLESAKRATAICDRYNGGDLEGLRLWCTAGIHPHDSGSAPQGYIEELRALHNERPDVLVAVGECGLDYDRDYSPRAVQRSCFEAQIALAASLGRPLFLHERGAHDDFYALLQEAGTEVASRSVVHCFTGERRALERYLALGCMIGITGWVCDERRGQGLQELVGEIPLDRILVETDAPYLTPRTLRPKPKRGRNEPSTLPHITRELATHMGRDEDELWRATSANAERLFGLPKRTQVH